MQSPRLFAALVALATLAAPATIHAQLVEVELGRGPTKELYIRKRPATPEPPRIPAELNTLLLAKEKQADAKRGEAIGLLRSFLASKPARESRAEALFKLAELLWEESRRDFVDDMEEYARKLESCRLNPSFCAQAPVEPGLDFSASERLYRAIIADHADFRRTDLVLYLIGFSAKEAGKNQESITFFEQVIERFPRSPLYADSWMMIGEYHFATMHWQEARVAYGKVIDHPDSATFDLALFKTAWCDWKLGEIDLAATRFKMVLDLAAEAEKSANANLRQRRAQLRDEALDYLVVVFTEDQTLSAADIYEFLTEIGGKQYSQSILVRVAQAQRNQAEYARAVDTYRFLIGQRPTSFAAADHQRKIVEAYLSALIPDRATAELRLLIDKYAPGGGWAQANRDSAKLARSLALTEELIRNSAQGFHATAQADEKQRGKPSLTRFERAAGLYQHYLTGFEKDSHAAEVRFLRAEILYFKLDAHEEAGDEYLAVGKSAPVGEYHKDALLKAMAAFEKARPTNVGGKRELLPVDRKFAAAVDLYATLFPADPDLVDVVFRNGQLFYDYGDYDEAIKRFGLIVTKYPDDPNAGPAGDRILGALRKAEDYENIEEWARKLKKAKAFRAADQQTRLDRLIVESIAKSGEKYGAAGKYNRAAKFYFRIAKEFPEHELAADSIYNAAVMLEKAKRPELAADAYLSLSDKYRDHELSARASYTAGQVYEKMAYFDRAAEAYEVVVASYPRSKHGADAMFNAGVLRQALGEHRKAIAHYQLYAKRFKKRRDAGEVAFRIGVVYEDSGDDGRAERAFRDYAKRYTKRGKHVIEAHTRAGRTALRLGHSKRASKQFKTALKLYKRLKKKPAKAAVRKWAAEARYLQGELVHRQYQEISLNVVAKRLKRTLNKKTKLLEQAQSIYLDVVDFGDLQWATAALFRIGQIYEVFAESLREAPIPPNLSKQEGELYKTELENYVVDIEDRAIELFATGYRKAIDLRVYNRYTRLIREALGRLSPSRFPPEHEARARVRVGDRPISPKLVEEVIRER